MAPMEVPPTKIGFDQAALAVWQAKLRYTPDASLLSQQAIHPIFIYDRLMEGQNDLAKELARDTYATAYTIHRFETWRKNLGKLSFPIALESSSNAPPPAWANLVRETSWFKDAAPAIIKGNLHNIHHNLFFELDNYYKNGLHFIRKKVKIQIPHRMSQPPYTEYFIKLWAWMYVGRKEHWDNQLDAGMFFSPVKINPPDLPQMSEYSFFVPGIGEPPEEDKPIKVRKTIQKSFPLYKGKEVVGSGFEHMEIEVPSEPNPYSSQIDGASPIQRILAESE